MSGAISVEPTKTRMLSGTGPFLTLIRMDENMDVMPAGTPILSCKADGKGRLWLTGLGDRTIVHGSIWFKVKQLLDTFCWSHLAFVKQDDHEQILNVLAKIQVLEARCDHFRGFPWFGACFKLVQEKLA